MLARQGSFYTTLRLIEFMNLPLGLDPPSLLVLPAKRSTWMEMRHSQHFLKRPRGQMLKLQKVRQLQFTRQTPYQAKLKQRDEGYGASLDIGCEELAILPEAELEVYIQSKQTFSGLLVASMQRRPVPREQLSALCADGWTPYEGVVLNRTDWGTLVDIGCEAPGLLMAGEELPQVSMTPKPTAETW
eukprot:g32403.t1